MNFLTKDMTISNKKLLAVILLFSSSFAWFFIFHQYFDNLISPGTSLDAFGYNASIIIFLVCIVISAFIGSIIVEKVNRRKFLLFWIVFGILATFPIFFFRGDEFLIIFAILAGSSFGLGFPSCQAFIADSTTPEERGRVAGIVILVSFVLVIFSFFMVSALALESTGILLLSILIKSIGFLSLALDPIKRPKGKPKPWRAVLGSKDFNYYLLAYVLFNVAAGLVSLLWQGLPPTPPYDDVTRIGGAIRLVGLGVFAIIAGVMADRIGRKKPILLGLIMLGAAYAVVGLLTSPETYFVNLMLSAMAWGVIMVVYLVVPGDLSYPGSTERYYTVGWVLPLIFNIGIQGIGSLSGFAPPIDLFSTILILILFTSIVPVLYAVETLSESKLRRRRFRDYTDKVGKIIQDSKK